MEENPSRPTNEKTQQLNYFINNNIIDLKSSKSISEHYLTTTFKIFSLLFKSFTEDLVYITKNLSIPKNLWNEKYFDNTKIINVSQKKDIFILYIYRMETFLLEFKKQRKITSDLIHTLCQEMNENFVNKAFNSSNTAYIYSDLTSEIKKEFEILRKKSYMEIIKFLVQYTLRLNEVLKISNLSNYDYIEEKEKEEVLDIQKYRILLTQFFSDVILNMLFDDLQQVLIFYIQEENKKSFSSKI